MADTASIPGLSPGFLSTEAASPTERWLALGVVAISVLAFAAGAPFVRTQLPHIPAFIPAYEGALWVTDTITAILLFGQFVRLRSRALLVLASGYLFTALIVIPHALTFPGAFSASGLLGAGTQTTAWLYTFWHTGFPLFVLGFSLLSRTRWDAMTGSPAAAIARATAGVILLVIVLTVVATVENDHLPAIMQGNNYRERVNTDFGPLESLIIIGVLVVVWVRSRPTVLELWVMIVLVSWLLDVSFSAVLGGGRFDLGFYAGRLYGLMAASFVLAGLLLEMNRLYVKITAALTLAEERNEELTHSREEFARVQRFEAIGQLIGGVAHDFNNILTVITGSLDLTLRDPAISSRCRRLLEASLAAAERGGRMNQQLLTFARRQILRPEVLNPNEVIANLEQFIAHSVGERVKLVTRLSPVVWPTQVDRVQFETALVNLAVNARDAMDGEGDLHIETRAAVLGTGAIPELPPGDYVRIAVRDSGHGMPPEVVERAFDPFFTTKEVGKGSGLGLSQVYGFARGAAGQVRIVSAPGEGTTVEIYLPKSAPAPPRVEPEGLAPVRAARNNETVLVVEDDPDVARIAVTGLRELGYIIKTAADARQALEILSADSEIDVLFADVVMPGGMNGAQLATEARRLRPDLKVLLTSGYAASVLARDLGLNQPLDLLPKPYRRDELARRLRLVISG